MNSRRDQKSTAKAQKRLRDEESSQDLDEEPLHESRHGQSSQSPSKSIQKQQQDLQKRQKLSNNIPDSHMQSTSCMTYQSLSIEGKYAQFLEQFQEFKVEHDSLKWKYEQMQKQILTNEQAMEVMKQQIEQLCHHNQAQQQQFGTHLHHQSSLQSKQLSSIQGLQQNFGNLRYAPQVELTFQEYLASFMTLNHYSIPSYKSVTFYRSNNTILIDGKDNILQSLDSVTLREGPKKNLSQDSYSYFFSSFHLGNVFLCCYDYGDLYMMEEKKLQIQMNINFDSGAITKMIRHQNDQQQYVIAVAQNGFVYVLKMATDQHNNHSNIQMCSKWQTEEQDDLLDIQHTHRQNEFLICSKVGFFYLSISRLVKDSFKFNRIGGMYYEDKVVKGAIEYDDRQVVCIVNGHKTVKFMDLNFDPAREVEVANPSQSPVYFHLVKFPNFDLRTFPYFAFRDSKSISLINVVKKRIFKVIESPLQLEAIRCYFLDIEYLSQEQSFNFYSLEYKRQADKHESVLRKYGVKREDLLRCLDKYDIGDVKE